MSFAAPSSLAAPAAAALTAMLVTTGRVSRRGLLVCALVLAALQAVYLAVALGFGLSHRGAAIYVVDAALLWMATCAVGKRLHDLGMSAWRILWVSLGVLGWSVLLCLILMAKLPSEALEPGAYGFVLAAAGTSLPVIALTLWLHLTPGMPGPNRYGIAPGDSGFCAGMPLSGGITGPAPAETEPHVCGTPGCSGGHLGTSPRAS